MRSFDGTTEELHHGKSRKLLSESPKSWEDAAQNAVREASKTLRNIRSLYVKEMTPAVENGRIMSYRLNSKVTLELESTRAGKK
jgi:flavin-binding protein dodecin